MVNIKGLVLRINNEIIYITNPNIYNHQGITVLDTAKNVPETSFFLVAKQTHIRS